MYLIEFSKYVLYDVTTSLTDSFQCLEYCLVSSVIIVSIKSHSICEVKRLLNY